MAQLCYINGQYIPIRNAGISIRDRGLQFADGVYDVVYFKNTHIIDAQAHFNSLAHSLAALNINHQLTFKQFCLYAHTLMQRNHKQEGLIYTQISRGNSQREHALKKQPKKPNIFMYLVSSSMEKKPVSIKIKSTEDIRWGGTYIKSLNVLGNIMARQRALDNGYDEALMYKSSGVITEAGSANVFFVVDGKLYTPPTDGHIFPGVTRARNIKIAHSLGINVIEESISLDDLKSFASEVFLATTSVGVMPVHQIDETPIGSGLVGPIAQKMRQAYYAFIDQDIKGLIRDV